MWQSAFNWFFAYRNVTEDVLFFYRESLGNARIFLHGRFRIGTLRRWWIGCSDRCHRSPCIGGQSIFLGSRPDPGTADLKNRRKALRSSDPRQGRQGNRYSTWASRLRWNSLPLHRRLAQKESRRRSSCVAGLRQLLERHRRSVWRRGERAEIPSQLEALGTIPQVAQLPPRLEPGGRFPRREPAPGGRPPRARRGSGAAPQRRISDGRPAADTETFVAEVLFAAHRRQVRAVFPNLWYVRFLRNLYFFLETTVVLFFVMKIVIHSHVEGPLFLSSNV